MLALAPGEKELSIAVKAHNPTHRLPSIAAPLTLREKVVLQQLQSRGATSYLSYPENLDSVQASQVEIWINLRKKFED
jgi:hypothetical protein